MPFGSHLSGGLADLADSDNLTLNTRSIFGFSALEPNLMTLELDAVTTETDATSIDLLVESRINNPNGQATLQLRNINTGAWQNVGSYLIGTTESVETVGGVDATNRIAGNGAIGLRIKHVVNAVFSALGFDSAFDQVTITVN